MFNRPFILLQDFFPSGYYGSFFYLGSGSISILIQIIRQFAALVRAFYEKQVERWSGAEINYGGRPRMAVAIHRGWIPVFK